MLFPYGTLVVNVTGSFLLGFALTFVTGRFAADTQLRLLLGTGFLGAYTTFSAFSYDTLVLLERGEQGLALLNSAASLLGTVMAAYAGVLLARAVG